jgi:Methylene-tetrahydrofolate reductase C terminal
MEAAVKKPVFGCRMCGQCVLHSTGMTCPMNCPKTLRNGPCGGVRADGGCEVRPEMRCVWLRGYERSQKLPLLPGKWRDEFNHLRRPVDNRLFGTASWANFASGRDRLTPAGWEAGEH